ncbi:MAG: sodium:solute symporter family protein [Bdellovibrionales bacterium]|nr:sodium:solute symporter family protein [Bdellovibrionales bacterium]
MTEALIYALVAYLVILLGIAYIASNKLETEEDFLVGGRKFNLWLTTFCLFATWFGAGTLIAASDEVAANGLKVTALEPYGAGLCLIFTGMFFAKPLWNMKIMTYGDLFKNKFGDKVELVSVILNIPIYVGWIAVQLVALANVLSVFFPAPQFLLIVLIALFTTLLTVMGGMWSVSLTDSFQMFIIILGLVYLFFNVIGGAVDGFQSLLAQVSAEKLVLIPTEKLGDLFSWLGVLSISALGNMTGQDLGQRVFSARSSKTAQMGCYISGVGYIVVGSIPVFLGLTAPHALGTSFEGSVIPNLIKSYLDPFTGLILVLTIFSAVISTITSALLSPSSLISHNYLKKHFPNTSTLTLSKLAVVFVAALSVLTAFAGENIYTLLENSYAIGLVGFFVPVTIALFSNKLSEKACLITIAFGISVWIPEFFGYENLPYTLVSVLLSYPVYFISYKYI